MQLKVKSVRGDGTAVVSTRGFRRIVGYPGGEPMIEFVARSNAKRCVEIYNACFPNGNQWAEAVKYGEKLNTRKAFRMIELTLGVPGKAAKRKPARRGVLGR